MRYDFKKFYNGKTVLLTGHTGFKGAWLTKILTMFGANVIGYSLCPPTSPALYDILNIDDKIVSVIGDIRDFDNLKNVFEKHKPDVVLHLAAQPIVRESYKNPRYTYETNVMGTVNVLECVRTLGCVKSCLNVTTDKVYKNNEWEWGYREDEPLDGYDPYSNSKSCSELVTHSYKNSFFNDIRDIGVSTARAGNVIGGGDFASDRIIPDCVRAAQNNQAIIVRNPGSTRPYQHVLEPLFAYLMIAMEQYGNENPNIQGYYNVGPDECDCVSTGELTDMFCKKFGNLKWESRDAGGPHEANFLKLDCSRLKSVFGWRPIMHVNEAVEKTVEWTKVYFGGGDINAVMENQIDEYRIKFI